MRISLRELMLVVAVAAIGMAALKYADTAMLTVLQATSGVLLLVLMVRAAVDRGRGQAFAIGFVVCSIAYIVASIASMTGRTGISTFGTLTALRELHKVTLTELWYNEATNQLAANFKPTQQEQESQRTTRLELQVWSPPVEVASTAVTTSEPAQQKSNEVQTAEATGANQAGGGEVRPSEQRSSNLGIDPQPGDRTRSFNFLGPDELQRSLTINDLANGSGGRGRGMDAELLRMFGGSGSSQRGSSFTTSDETQQPASRGRRGSALSAEQAAAQRGGAARGGARRGRGSTLGQLSSDQLNEYAALTPEQRSKVSTLLAMQDGLAAVQTGRPLSTMNVVSYIRRVSPSYDQFEVAGRCLWTLLIGYIGGLAGRYFYARRTTQDAV